MNRRPDDSFLSMRRDLASRVGTVLEQSLRESSMITGARQILSEASRRMAEESDPSTLRRIFAATTAALDTLLSCQHTVRNRHFSFLSTSLQDSLRVLSTLERTTTDVSVLSFEIRLLERFIITSEVIYDWKDHVKKMVNEIDQVIEIFVLFSIFLTEENHYEVEVFWKGTPREETRRLFERLTTERLRKAEGLNLPERIPFIHNIADPSKPLPEIPENSLTLSTKSLLLESPRIGGIVGVGLHFATAQHPVKILVVESIITSVLNVVGSVKAIYKYTKDIEYYAVRDPLTGLFNQRVFWELLSYEIGRSNRHGKIEFSLLILDVDDFKKINDTFGHTFGDSFLQTLAALLSETARREDIVARYGGDEFAVILPEAGPEQAAAFARRLLERLRSFALESPEGFLAKISLSLGIATWPSHASEARDLFLVADNMMYRAKSQGKNTYCLPTDADVVEVFRMASEKYVLLQQAIADHSILPYFQPIVSTATGDVAAYEVLMRLLIDGRPLPASDFIEIAEESGLISRLDFIVMEKAFRMAAEKGFRGLLFINISPKAVVTGDFIPALRRLMRETGIDPRQVVFEITERETVRNASLLEIFISELKNDGTRFAIDDFGSGFSSMTYLKRFSVDFLKVEGDFIRSLPDPAGLDRAIVASIVTLAREAGIETVAECVESPEILALARSFGLTYAQGFAIGLPSPEIV